MVPAPATDEPSAGCGVRRCVGAPIGRVCRVRGRGGGVRRVGQRLCLARTACAWHRESRRGAVRVCHLVGLLRGALAVIQLVFRIAVFVPVLFLWKYYG